MKITIYGCGYVGLVTAACFASLGHEVLAYDIDENKIDALNQGKSPIYEAGLSERLQSPNLQFTTDLSSAVAYSPIQFICVGTPESADGSADLSYVTRCAETIADQMTEDKLIVIKSTVPVGTGDALMAHLATRLTSRHIQVKARLISNPEFLREGLAIADFMHPERVIIGGDDRLAMETVARLYQAITDEKHPVLFMDRRSSELSKYAANAMLATRISFMNEISQIAERVGARIDEVALSMGFDSRIGPQFLKAGCGYGGSCFPKDVSALRFLAKRTGYEPKILESVETVNAEQKRVVAEKIYSRFGHDLSGITFAIWGLSFKPDTDDIREASSLVLIRELLSHSATIQAYDPVANENTDRELGPQENLYFMNSAREALKDADALVLVTEWSEFKSIPPTEIQHLLKQPIIFDGRNLYQPEEWVGAEYFSIGRGRWIDQA